MTRICYYILFYTLVLTRFPEAVHAQAATTIRKAETDRIIQFLAADERKGRGNGSVELQQTAHFIAKEYAKAGLHFFAGNSFFIPFHPHRNKVSTPYQLLWNNKKKSEKDYQVLNTDPALSARKSISDFAIIQLDSFFTEDVLFHLDQSPEDRDILLWTDKLRPGTKRAFPQNIKIPPAFIRQVILVYAKMPPTSIALIPAKQYQRSVQYNMAGLLPGKAKGGEIVLFSAHYDHLGKGYNGANDNASGVTALLLLADYFAKKKNNERTLLFCAFSGEEDGLLGSTYFSRQVNADSIIAGINLEMLGVPQYGATTIFITGGEHTALPSLLIPDFEKAGLKVINEPAAEKNLFQRSDNYPFAQKGVPAHTIMASDDDDPCYHKRCDDLTRIDIDNLTAIIQAIAKAVEGLVNGTVMPPRLR